MRTSQYKGKKEAPGVIITGGDFQALGALRTFAKKKIPVIVCDSVFMVHNITSYSRFRSKYCKSPKIWDESAFIDFFLELAVKKNLYGWLVLPNNDRSVYIFSKYKELLNQFYTVPIPDLNVIENLYIKKNTYQLAEKNGIPIPKSFFPSGLDELMNMDFDFPMVVKPSVRDHFFEKVKKKAFKVSNKADLEKKYRYVCSIIDPCEIIVQEFIPGGSKNLYSFCPFFKDGRIIAGIGARRTRQHPMDFGRASTFAELVDIPEIETYAQKFLSQINYYGIAEVEFMYDPISKDYKLIEVNPRIWGWHSLAIAAGADLPYYLYLDSIGKSLAFQPIAKTKKWIRLITDIPTVLSEIVKRRMTILEYIDSMRGDKEFAVFSLADPLPFVAEILLLPYLIMKKGY